MTEAEFIKRLTPHVPRGCCASDVALALVTEAVAAFPRSAALWFLHGRITMAASDNDVSDMAARSFEMAIVFDPTLAEAHKALGDYGAAKLHPATASQFHRQAARPHGQVSP